MWIPGWWFGCGPRNPRTLSAHMEALTLVLASKTPQGTFGFCSKILTSLHCCSHWGSWRGCRGWQQLWRGRTCWTPWLTLLFPGQSALTPVPIWANSPLKAAPQSCQCLTSWVLGPTEFQQRAVPRHFSTVAFLKPPLSFPYHCEVETKQSKTFHGSRSWGFAWNCWHWYCKFNDPL